MEYDHNLDWVRPRMLTIDDENLEYVAHNWPGHPVVHVHLGIKMRTTKRMMMMTLYSTK